MGIKGYTVHCGPDSPQVINGLRVTNGLVWPKDIMGHTWAGSYNGLQSYWTAQMKLLGLILIGVTGRELAGRKWAIYEHAVNRLSVGQPVTF